MTLNDIQQRLGYQFREPQLLAQAFVHRSYWNEHRDQVPGHNEQLELVGDAVLRLLVIEWLYQRFPGYDEGQLSQLSSHLVEASSCVAFVKTMQVESALLLGRGEKSSGARGRSTILADLFEAVLGAVYLDGGLEAARQLFHRLCIPVAEQLAAAVPPNWKAQLQEWSQRHMRLKPSYRCVSEEGPGHQKEFEVVVFLGDQELGRGSGGSKKAAEQEAARAAWKRIELGEFTGVISESS
jgi:ribonuclease III